MAQVLHDTKLKVEIKRLIKTKILKKEKKKETPTLLDTFSYCHTSYFGPSLILLMVPAGG